MEIGLHLKDLSRQIRFSSSVKNCADSTKNIYYPSDSTQDEAKHFIEEDVEVCPPKRAYSHTLTSTMHSVMEERVPTLMRGKMARK